VLETKDEHFDYYRDFHAFWKLYRMDLSDDVLRKVYYQNALRITPGYRRQGGNSRPFSKFLSCAEGEGWWPPHNRCSENQLLANLASRGKLAGK
jgi:hypothetical protein